MSDAAGLYPNLERYLATVRVADNIYDPRNPDFWWMWSFVTACLWVQSTFGWLWTLPVFAAGWVGADLRRKRRNRGKPLPKALADAVRTQLPSRIGRLAKTGKLAATIGETGATALERCATFAVRTRADLSRACAAVGGSEVQAELRREILDGVGATMDHAFRAFEKRLTSPGSSAPTDLLMVVEAERELELLASAVAAWMRSVLASSAQPEFARFRDQLRVIREMRSGYHSEQPASADGGLENIAKS